MPGFEVFDGCAFCFLIEHPAFGRRLVFGLGGLKDWENLAPSW